MKPRVLPQRLVATAVRLAALGLLPALALVTRAGTAHAGPVPPTVEDAPPEVIVPNVPDPVSVAAPAIAKATALEAQARRDLEGDRLKAALARTDEAIGHHPTAARHLLRAELLERLGRHVDAFRSLLTAEHLDPGIHGPGIRAKLAGIAARLDPPLGLVEVRAHPSHAFFTVGELTFASAGVHLIGVHEGNRAFLVEAAEHRPTTREVDVTAGAVSRLAVVLDDPRVPALATEAAALSGPPRWPGYLLLSAGGALAAAGVVFGVLALDNESDLERLTPASPSFAERSSDLTSQRDRNRLLAWTLGGTGAAALLAGIIYLVLLDGEAGAPVTSWEGPRLDVLPTPGGTGMAATWTF